MAITEGCHIPHMSGDEPRLVIMKVSSRMYDDMKRLKLWAGVLAWVIGVAAAAAVVVILFPAMIDIIFRLD